MPRRKSNAIRRRPNRPRRKQRSRVPRSLGGNSGHSGKIYTYNFSLGSQILRSGTSQTEPPVNLVGAAQPWSVANNFQFAAAQSSLPFTYDVGFAGTFSLNDVLNHPSFVLMYDQYRINHITLELENLTSPSYSPGVSVAGVPGAAVQPLNSTVYLAIDRDDATVPLSVDKVQRFQGVRKLTTNTAHNRMRIKFKPNAIISMEVPSANPLGGLAKPGGQWLDCATENVTHYGLKGWITDWVSGGNISQVSAYRMTWTYNVSFRQPQLTT